MRSHRDSATLIEGLLDPDDDMGGDDSGERARIKSQIEIPKRRWRPDELKALSARGELRTLGQRQRALERLRALGARY